MLNFFCFSRIFTLSLLGLLNLMHNSSSKYQPVEPGYNLTHVIVLLRHGDRIQITRELGNAFHESRNTTRFWKSKLPVESTLRSLLETSYPKIKGNLSSESLRKRLYSGWDNTYFPYGQLTERGANQLKLVGYKYWSRYRNFLLGDKDVFTAESLYCRSTNICRTLLSLRSFLAGFFQHTVPYSRAHSANRLIRRDKLPTITARPKTYETMYPSACDALARRRLLLIEQNFNNATNIPDYYQSLERRLQVALGVHGSFSWLTWLNVMEIFHCYENHGVSLPPGVSKADSHLVTRFVTWTWGELYRDDILLRFALGRFFKEVVDDTRLMVEGRQPPQKRPFFFQLGLRGYLRGEAQAQAVEQAVSEPASNDESSTSGTTTSVRDSTHGVGAPLNGSASTRQDREQQPVSAARTPSIPNPLTKLLVYSGHDATMVPVLVALGLYKDNWPDYASHLAFEFASRTESGITSSTVAGASVAASNHRILNSNFQHDDFIDGVAHRRLSTILTPVNSSSSVEADSQTGTRISSRRNYVSSRNRNVTNAHPKSRLAGLLQQVSKQFSSSANKRNLDRVYVRVVYNDEAQILPGCDFGPSRWCPYVRFMSLFEKYAISHEDYTRQCEIV